MPRTRTLPELPCPLNTRDNHSTRPEARDRRRGAKSPALSAEEEEKGRQFAREILLLPTVAKRLNFSLWDESSRDLAKRVGFVLPAPSLGGERGQIPSADALEVVRRVDRALREELPWEQALVRTAEYTGIGRVTVAQVRKVDLEFDGAYVPGAALQRKRGPLDNEDHTDVMTREHLLVLQMQVNLCQKFASDRSTMGLADMMRNLPLQGLPNLPLKAFLASDQTMSKFKTEEYEFVAGSSPGPVMDCSDQQIRRAFEVLNRSGTIDVHIEFGTRERKKSQGSTLDSSDAKLAARREFQVEYFMNKLLPEFDARARQQHPPQPNFEVGRDFRFEPWMLTTTRGVLFKDETWITMNMTTGDIWIDESGEDVADPKGGERYVVFTAVDADGFCTWERDDYGKNNHLYHMKCSDTMYSKHVKGIKQASGIVGREPDESERVDGFTFGIGGVYMFPCNMSAGEKETSDSYKRNMNGKEMGHMMRHMLKKLDTPHMIVCDNAPYNRVFSCEDGVFDVWQSTVTLGKAVEFLKDCYEEDAQAPLSKIYAKFYNPATGTKLPGVVAVKDDILALMRAEIKKPELSELQRLAAEVGIRTIGYPHLVLYLPARTPSWDPVELVFAQLKSYFRRHREPRMKDGAPVGSMGKAEFLKLLSRMWSFFDAGDIGRCFAHCEKLYEQEWDEDGDNELQARQLKKEFRTALNEAGIQVPAVTRGGDLAFLFQKDSSPQKDNKGRVKSGLTPKRNNRRPADDDASSGDADVQPQNTPAVRRLSWTASQSSHSSSGRRGTPSTARTTPSRTLRSGAGSRRSPAVVPDAVESRPEPRTASGGRAKRSRTV